MKKKNKITPFGMTLIEVLVSLVIFAIISAVCIKALETLIFGYERLEIVSREQKDISETFRFLDGDFKRNSYRKKEELLRIFNVPMKSFILPNGEKWTIDKGVLVRQSLSVKGFEMRKIMMNDVEKLELKVWDRNNFIHLKDKSSNNKTSYLGFEVKIYLNSKNFFRRLFIVRCLP